MFQVSKLLSAKCGKQEGQRLTYRVLIRFAICLCMSVIYNEDEGEFYFHLLSF
jgi:hypothetical protein